MVCWYVFVVFKQKTAYEMRISDWSSDVGSSDLINTWNALLAPQGTPQAVVDALNAAVRKAMGSPSLRQHFEQEGAVPTTGTPAELRDFIRGELDKWAAVVKSVTIRVD